MKIESFQDLKVWDRAHQLSLKIYKISKHFPDDERFGITSQIRRSSVSICANIAEGTQKSTKEYIRFLNIARGSLEETKYYLILIKDLGFCTVEQFDAMFDEINQIGRMLHGLKVKLTEKLNYSNLTVH